MTAAEALGRSLLAMVVLGIAVAVFVLALNLAETLKVSRSSRAATRGLGVANLVAASAIAAAIWMAP